MSWRRRGTQIGVGPVHFLGDSARCTAGRSRTATVLGRGKKPQRSAGALRHVGEHLHCSALSDNDMRKAAYSIQGKGTWQPLSLHRASALDGVATASAKMQPRQVSVMAGHVWWWRRVGACGRQLKEPLLSQDARVREGLLYHQLRRVRTQLVVQIVGDGVAVGA